MTFPHWIVLARWLLGGALAVFGAYIVAFNWATIPWNANLAARGEQRHVSPAPISGPLLLTVGVLVALWRPTFHVAWFWLADSPTCTLPLSTVLATRRS